MKSCGELQASDLVDTVNEQFLRYLTTKGICQEKVTMSCHISDLTLQCGPLGEDYDYDYEWRRKRSIDPEQLKFKFNVTMEAIAVKDLECEECGGENNEQCEQRCKEQYMSQAMTQLNQTTNNITDMFGRDANTGAVTSSSKPIGSHHKIQTQGGSNNSNVSIRNSSFHDETGNLYEPKDTFTINGITLLPQGQVRLSEAKIRCGVGMESSNGVCGEWCDLHT